MLRCSHVWDGQTIQASDGVWMVLDGVCTPPLDKPGGKQARERLSLIVQGHPIMYDTVGSLRGAVIARVWLPHDTEDISVNRMMVAAGYGPH